MAKTEQDESRYEIKAIKSAVQVIEFLAAGDLLGYRSLREIAAGLGLSPDRTYRILSTLIACHWAEKTQHGFRLAVEAGLLKHLVYAQKYLSRLAANYGVKINTDS